jgi:hypothetical protein
MRTRPGWRNGIGVLLLAMLAGSGCALRYTDRHGNLNTIGWVWTATPPTVSARPAEPAGVSLVFRPETLTEAPFALRQRAFGLVLDDTIARKGLTLGYQDLLIVFPAENAVTEFSFDSTRPLDARLQIDRLAAKSVGAAGDK